MVSEMLSYIDNTLARPGRAMMELRVPTLWGIHGRFLRDDEVGPVYGYSKRKCRKIRAIIYEAARHDLGQP